jgi:hypothetical protein
MAVNLQEITASELSESDRAIANIFERVLSSSDDTTNDAAENIAQLCPPLDTSKDVEGFL